VSDAVTVRPYYQDDHVTLWHGDCIEVMRELPDASVDAVVTDPPYELGFMGKGWDASGIAYHPEVWAQAYRVLKPGGHLLAFGGTRTWHRLAVAVEDAGFDVRDSIAWMYGSGFPKSLDVSKAIDKAAGAEREVVGTGTDVATRIYDNGEGERLPSQIDITAPATLAAQQWQGWGTALKPAFEPIVVARKPLIGTVAANVLTHGTGALNIDGCRVGTEEIQVNTYAERGPFGESQVGNGYECKTSTGRWPANVILDESQAAELDKQSGVTSSGRRKAGDYGLMGYMGADIAPMPEVTGDIGGASRFFYTAKASSAERPKDGDTAHPTVKPLDLMRYLVRLVTPPGGTVLEPFAGSGTTLEACIVEGFSVIGIELTEEYLPLIVQRVSKPIEQVLL
jgi:DNA modification methylase